MKTEVKLIKFTKRQVDFLDVVKEKTLLNFNAQIRALVDQEMERVKKLKDAG